MQLRALLALASVAASPVGSVAHDQGWAPAFQWILGAKYQGHERPPCATVSLPDSLLSSPQPTSGWERSGFWETFDGAALATWSQTALGPDTGMQVMVDSKVLTQVDATPLDPDGRERVDGMSTVLAFEDCEGEPLFEVHEHATPDAPLEVYDRDHKLMAKGRKGTVIPDEFFWESASGELLATAHRKKVGDDVNVFAGVPHWSIEFSPTTVALEKEELFKPQNRWKILAATQVRAIRNADRDDDGVVKAGPISLWLSTWAVLKWVLLSAGVYSVLHFIYIWVYFPEEIGLRSAKRKGTDYGAVEGPRKWMMWRNLP